MFYLHWKKIAVVFFVIGMLVTKVQAQDPHWSNLPTYDDKFMHYGFSIGINSTGYRYKYGENYLSDTLKSIKPIPTVGFTLGFITNFRLSNYFDLRVLPTVSFYERTLDYKYVQGSVTRQTIESTFIELPMLVKYKSQRRKNSRMYLVAGTKLGVEAGAKKKERRASDLRTNSFDFALDYGIGFDIYYPLFKFSPEIRFSHGLVNILQQDNNLYSKNLTKLTTHTVTLYLHFE